MSEQIIHWAEGGFSIECRCGFRGNMDQWDTHKEIHPPRADGWIVSFVAYCSCKREFYSLILWMHHIHSEDDEPQP
jgi:hypothetical protein